MGAELGRHGCGGGAPPPVSRPGTAHRLGRARASPWRSRRLSSRARRTARDRYPQPLTGVGHEVSRPRERPTGTRLRRHEKNATAGGCAAFWRTASGCPKRPFRCSAAQGQSFSRKTVAEVPLTGLFFPVWHGQWCRRLLFRGVFPGGGCGPLVARRGNAKTEKPAPPPPPMSHP